MACRDIRNELIAYASGEALDEASLNAVREHLSQCPECERRLRWEQRVHEAVQSEEQVPEPSPDFEQRVLKAATAEREDHRPRWVWHSMVGGAVAAALVVGIMVGTGMDSPGDPSPDAEVPEVVEAERLWEREETVRLSFNSRSRLDDVSLTIELPPHVEMSRFPGHQELTWKVDLEPGDNVIALPLRVAYPEDGEIVAHLGEGDDRRTFVAPIPGLSETQQEPAL